MATYSIDGNNLQTLGFDVQEVTGIYSTPARKKETEVSPVLADGIVPFTGSNDIFKKEREIVIKCYLRVTTVQDAIDKLKALQTLLYTAGTRSLEISYSKYSYTVFCKDGANIKRLTSVGSDLIAYSVDIKLTEISKSQQIFDDWFLPSNDEWMEIYTNLMLFGIGDILGKTSYWASSEFDATNAYYFNEGSINYQLKTDEFNNTYVRACRSFTAGAGAYALRDTGPAGGLIFSIVGTTYYEAAPSDFVGAYAWSNITAVAVTGTGTAIGTGQANTDLIIAQAGHTDSAAKLCDDLIVEL